MQVKQIIENLQKFYKPEDTLIVAYWDKDIVERYLITETLTDDQWETLVDDWEAGDEGFSEQLSSDLNYIMHEEWATEPTQENGASA